MKIIRTSSITLIIVILQLAAQASYANQETAFTFKSNSNQEVDAFKGSFTVPENRSNPNSRLITINYVRFPSTGKTSGSPIVYLSGGPGGSGIGTAKRQRFPLFMAMREFGDVIALDQRGTGAARKELSCVSKQNNPHDKAISDEEYFQLQREALYECARTWKHKGIDVNGYTTPENARDLDDLRKHLGAQKISLWGISYGTHLALTAIKQMDDRLDKVIIATVEGLDQTVKMPARTDAYFDRLQNAINTNSELAQQFPDIKKLIRRVHKKLEAQPLTLNLLSEKRQITTLWQRRNMQQVSASMIADPATAMMLLNIYAALDANNTAPLIDLIQRFGGDLDAPISFGAMSYAMDEASGQSKQRYDEVFEQAKTSLLASHLNASIHLTGVIAGLDLGDSFREKPNSDVPTLVLMGSLDGRIYPESQQEATSGLTNRKVIRVENAGHNLFMTSPEVSETMLEFMRGESIEKTKIVVDLPW